MKIFQQLLIIGNNNSQGTTPVVKYNMPAKNNSNDIFVKNKNLNFKGAEQDILQKFLNNPELRSNLAKFLAEGLTAGLASLVALKEVKTETSSTNDEMQAVIEAKDKEIQAWQEYYENTSEIEENHQPIKTDSKYTYHAQREKELYEAFLNDADEQVKTVNNEAIEILVKNDELTKNEEKNRAEINKLQQENQTLTGDNKEKDTQLNILQQENKSLAEDKKQSEAQAKKLTDENKTLKAKEKESREKSETLKKSLHKLQNSYDSLNRFYTETNRKYKEALNSIAYIDEQNRDLRFDNNDLTADLNTVKAENKNLKSEIEELKKENRVLEGETEKKDAIIATFDMKKDDQIKQLNNENYQLTIENIKSNEKNEQLQESNHSLKNQLNTSTKENKTLTTQLNQTLNDNEQLKAQIEELKEKFNKLKKTANSITTQENINTNTEAEQIEKLPFPKKRGRLSSDEEELRNLVNKISQDISVDLNNQLINLCNKLMSNKELTDGDGIVGNKTLVKKLLNALYRMRLRVMATSTDTQETKTDLEPQIQRILNKFKKYGVTKEHEMLTFSTGRTETLQYGLRALFKKFIFDYNLKKGQNLRQKEGIYHHLRNPEIIAEIKRHDDWENITVDDAEEITSVINNTPEFKKSYSLHSAMRFIDRMVDFHDRFTPLEEKTQNAIQVFEKSLQNALKNGVSYSFYEEVRNADNGNIITYYTPTIIISSENLDERFKEEFESLFGNQPMYVSIVNEYNPEEKNNGKYYRKKLIGTIYKVR